MKLKCVYTESDALTVGDVYEVLRSTSYGVVFEDDNAEVKYYPREWFDII